MRGSPGALTVDRAGLHFGPMSNRPRQARPGEALSFSPVNWALLIAGIAAIAVGYLLLSGGSTVLAPLLLVLGYYVVLLPASIIL